MVGMRDRRQKGGNCVDWHVWHIVQQCEPAGVSVLFPVVVVVVVVVVVLVVVSDV